MIIIDIVNESISTFIYGYVYGVVIVIVNITSTSSVTVSSPQGGFLVLSTRTALGCIPNGVVYVCVLSVCVSLPKGKSRPT